MPARRQVDLAPLRDPRRDGVEPVRGAQLPRRRGHDLDAGRGPGARRAVDAARRRLDDPRRRPARRARAGGPIDVGNAGTLMRLLPGWLAGQEGRAFTLDGDDSIRRRPVDRIAAPLRAMGAGSTPPTGACRRSPSRRPRCAASTYELPVASAQVKSCVLLAGLMPTARPRSSSRRPAATTPSGCSPPPARAVRRDGRGVTTPADGLALRTSHRPRRPVVGGVPVAAA